MPFWLICAEGIQEESMKRFAIASSLFGLLLAGQSFSQSGAVIPQGGAGHAVKASCIILKRMGPADQITSHMYSFGIRGKQFQYVEGKLPEGFPFHGRLTDHDVRNLQARGAEIEVVNPSFTAEDLRQARADCRGETGTTPNQSEAKSEPAQPPAGTAAVTEQPAASLQPAAVSTVAPVVASTGKLSVVSLPDSADIEVDGSFVGDTPSDVQVTEGEHTIAVKKAGFKDWERKLKVSGGSSVHLTAGLEKAAQ
jgi:PEGA domain